MPDTFVIALPRALNLGDPVASNRGSGHIVEILDRKQYLEEWLAAGLPGEWCTLRACLFFCRVELHEEVKALMERER